MDDGMGFEFGDDFSKKFSTKVQMKGLNQRGKNRINEHGDIMSVSRRETFGGVSQILVYAADGWMGWFTFKEIEIIKTWRG